MSTTLSHVPAKKAWLYGTPEGEASVDAHACVVAFKLPDEVSTGQDGALIYPRSEDYIQLDHTKEKLVWKRMDFMD